jgi:hypothetical protein
MKLFGAKYKIRFFESRIDVDFFHREMCEGSADTCRKEIRLWRTEELSDAAILTTYCHELVHVFAIETGVKLDERKVNLLALALSSWLQENGIKVPVK